jgi:hypothetical protein
MAEPVANDASSLSPPVMGEREPHLARFGLRQLLWAFSAATIFCGVLVQVDGAWPIIIGGVAALVMAHVFGTFLGTRLRDTSRQVQHWKGRPGSPDRDEPVALPQPVSASDLPAPSALPLASFEQLHHWCNWCLAGGFVLGAALGAWGINAVAGAHVTWFGIALGSTSTAVLGAWIVLLSTNFWIISRHALHHATRDK